jgi:hypothetical protein
MSLLTYIYTYIRARGSPSRLYYKGWKSTTDDKSICVAKVVTSQYWTREPKETIIWAIFPNHVEKTPISNQPMKPKRNTNRNHPK